ncbi:hypothetical protein RJ640_028850 [Escallonia rubra]|uniref:Uncharacterized protein n=1 Tax=Escallonia rubra TaxID=112253 RepID=A0AA88U5G3_9ASTE|nr:hypothetical protein RJ640_028850 [Escallonia rubra]
MGDARRPPAVSISSVETADKVELYRALEASLGSPLRSDPYVPNPLPESRRPSRANGNGATSPTNQIIKRQQEVRSGIHFVVTRYE